MRCDFWGVAITHQKLWMFFHSTFHLHSSHIHTACRVRRIDHFGTLRPQRDENSYEGLLSQETMHKQTQKGFDGYMAWDHYSTVLELLRKVKTSDNLYRKDRDKLGAMTWAVATRDLRMLPLSDPMTWANRSPVDYKRTRCLVFETGHGS